jgi:hypothetical protein
LVVRKGWIILGGSHEYPVLQAQTSVHPWFLVDAIRWYAEHPEHRADIGTQSEHDRLLATLVPQLPPKPEIIRPPRPRTVSIALWLTWAGFAWGLLWSCWNLGLALTFEDRIRATAVASDDGLASTTAIGSTVWGLVLAAVVGIGAVALARSVRKGNDAARMGLLLLCGAIVLWAPCGSSLTAPMVMLDFDDLLGQLMTASFFGNQAVSVGLAVAILVLLTVEPSNRYFRPKA